MPASSPDVSSMISTLYLWRSPQRAYMRNSMRAQSHDSVPPAPEMHLDIGIVGVDLARQKRLDLASLGLDLERLQLVDPFLFGGGIVFHLAEFDERRGILEVPLEPRDGAEPILEIGPLAHHLLRGIGIVPEVGVLDPGVQLGEASRR